LSAGELHAFAADAVHHGVHRRGCPERNGATSAPADIRLVHDVRPTVFVGGLHRGLAREPGHSEALLGQGGRPQTRASKAEPLGAGQFPGPDRHLDQNSGLCQARGKNRGPESAIHPHASPHQRVPAAPSPRNVTSHAPRSKEKANSGGGKVQGASG